MHHPISRYLAPLVVVAVSGAPLAAQAERYELGRRLKAFEAAWERHDAPAARARALDLLPQLTNQFFSFRFGEAGRTLDLAAEALRSELPPGAGRQWLMSLSPLPEARLVDGSARELRVTIRPFYAVGGDPPQGLELRLWFTERDVVVVRPERFPVTVTVPLPPLGESRGLDRRLYFLADGAKELRPASVGVSQVADLKPRLAALRKRLEGLTDPEATDTLERATARARLAALSQAAVGADAPVPVTDLPYAEWLANAEAMLDGRPFFTAERPGQFWLSVPTGRGTATPCRLFVPKGLDRNKPVPVVVALHGAGVDENMFFESYGAGHIVRECEQRGWLLVAPRSGLGFTGGGPPVARLVTALAERYPLDPQRVFVVGHSMGAMQAAGQVAAGSRFAAVALLGGGGRLARTDAFAELPVFIGVGDRDTLARSGARALNQALTAAGAKAVTFKEYAGVEHLVIVRQALPDVFALFDQVAGHRP